MKGSIFKDYTKASEYFTDENEKLLSQDIENAEKQKKYVVWIQEFSKKIVTVIFLFYIVMSVFSAYIVYKTWQLGMVSGIDTLISEMNMTFREIVGGYIVKSAVENAVKIAGNYYIGIVDARLRAMKEGLKDKGIKGMGKNDSENNDYNNGDFIDA